MVLVGLQVLILTPVAEQHHQNGKVKNWLGRLVSTEVLVNVLTEQTSGLLWSRSSTNWQLLVERDKLGHSLGIWVGANVLKLVYGLGLNRLGGLG